MTTVADSITLRWWALEMAFGHVVDGHWSFLDRKTGRVISLSEEVPEDREPLHRISIAGERYLYLEPVGSREQYSSTIGLRCEGVDADKAFDALGKLITSGFGEL
jgi:hypothetical protein